MRLLITLTALLNTSLLFAQDNLSRVKAHIINEIVQKLKKTEKDQRTVVVADMGNREMRISSGTAGSSIEYLNTSREDSVAVKLLRDSFFVNMGKRLSFKTFKEVKYNSRNDVINDYIFKSRDFANLVTYLEIAAPIDGWEVGALFRQDKGLYNEERYTQFYVPRFNIPVFIFTSNDNEKKEEKRSYLFRYKLIFSNEQLSVKLIDWNEI